MWKVAFVSQWDILYIVLVLCMENKFKFGDIPCVRVLFVCFLHSTNRYMRIPLDPFCVMCILGHNPLCIPLWRSPSSCFLMLGARSIYLKYYCE